MQLLQHLVSESNSHLVAFRCAAVKVEFVMKRSEESMLQMM